VGTLGSRKTLLLVPIVGTLACVDAPITRDQLEANGRLRPATHEQAAFSARERLVPQQAVHLSAVLAAQSEGALEDASSFAADVGAVHLHLRVDGWFDPRPVVFRWTYDEVSVEVPGILAPAETLSLAASYPIDRDQTGTWMVEVLGTPEGPDAPSEAVPVLYQREFEVVPP
jgi:hypothetical protein